MKKRDERSNDLQAARARYHKHHMSKLITSHYYVKTDVGNEPFGVDLGLTAVVNAVLKNKNNVWVSIELKDINCTITDHEISEKRFMKKIKKALYD